MSSEGAPASDSASDSVPSSYLVYRQIEALEIRLRAAESRLLELERHSQVQEHRLSLLERLCERLRALCTGPR